MANIFDEIGVVVIGRNEGERLKKCLQGLLSQVARIVYVDSGSSDGSVQYAKSIDIDVVQLDMRIPFSAGRARNEGFFHLHETYKHLKYVQFIDGDCEICAGWLSFASAFLEENEAYAVAAGRRHEKFPEQSIYNMLCDIEWDTPIGVAEVCGGDFMIREKAFLQVSGFNPIVISGEEPDLCYRLRQHNWLIYRLDHSMTLHDAAMTRFSQWWKRTVRCGHFYAQGYTLHAHDGQGYCLRLALKCWIWALFFPVTVIGLAILISPVFLLLFVIYVIQIVMLALQTYKRSGNRKNSIIYSFFTVLAKWPQLIGQLLFIKRMLMKERLSIIEYD